jgi:hypothetical protein
MNKSVKKQYANITLIMINTYLASCQQCVLNKKRNKTTGITIKPIIETSFNKRAQIDLIDLQSIPDGEFKWLMVYQDHFTKFIRLTPIRAKSAMEVAYGLIDFFFFIWCSYYITIR